MRHRFRTWLNNVALHDPIQQRQAAALQIMLLCLMAATIIGIPLSFFTLSQSAVNSLALFSYALVFVGTAMALVLIRYGRFELSVIAAAGSIVIMLGIWVIAAGLLDSGATLLTFALPITLVGMLATRRMLALTYLIIATLLITALVLEQVAPNLVGILEMPGDNDLSLAVTATLIIGLLAVFLDSFGSSLRNALSLTLNREQELEFLRANLEATVAERTASLQQTIADLRASQETIRVLNVPVLPVLPGVLVIPLIGALDKGRTALLNETVLNAVVQNRAHHAILDITGVPLLDTTAAQALVQTANAIQLLGTQTVLVGIRADVAHTIVQLGINLETLVIYPNLQEAVAALWQITVPH